MGPYAVLAVVPLGLAQCGIPRPLSLVNALPLLAAAASFAVEQGWLAALLCAPYCLWAMYLAGTTISRLRARGSHPLHHVAVDAAIFYLAGGAIFLELSRAGLYWPRFTDAVVLMTALHLHYAGFAACVFVALTGSGLGRKAETPLYRFAAWAVIAGTPLMTLGTALTRWLEVAAALLMAVGVTLVSALAMLTARSRGVSLLFSITAAATVLAMAIAGMYALTQVAGAFWLPIPQMAIVHGVANAFGFATIGLVAHWINQRS